MSLEDIKLEIIDLLRNSLMPRQLKTEVLERLNDETTTYTFYQTFIPFVRVFSRMEVALKKTGSPTGSVFLAILDKDDNLLVEEEFLPAEIGDGFIGRDITLEEEPTLTYTLRVRTDQAPSATDYYEVYTSTEDEYLVGKLKKDATSLEKDLSFKIEVEDFIYPIYPEAEFKLTELPRVWVDVFTQLFEERFLGGTIAEERIRIVVDLIASHTREMDVLDDWLRRMMFYKRFDVTNLQYIAPVRASPLTSRDSVLFRTLEYMGRRWVTK